LTTAKTLYRQIEVYRGISMYRKKSNIVRKRIKGLFCVYCGEDAESDDHFPPKSLTPLGLLLPCCKECNAIAGTMWSCDFEERCQYVKDKLRTRYQKQLKTPSWSQDELDELDYNMRQVASQWQEQRDRIHKRLAWNAHTYLSSIDHNNYFAQFYARIDGIMNDERATWRRIEA
jgi:hypothetical protein